MKSRRAFLKWGVLGGAAIASSDMKAWANHQSDIAPTDKALTFLFQGDSITDGNRGRTADPNHIMGHGYAYGIASRVGADFPNANNTFYNRGISGNTITDLEKRWQQDTMDIHPDVLSILIGINDVNKVVNDPDGSALQSFENTYRKLLDTSLAQNKNTLFVLGLPFVFAVGNDRKNNWNVWKEQTELRAAIVKRLAKDYNALLIDYPRMFSGAAKLKSIDYWIWDGIHPTVFGHELMTREWIKVAAKRISILKHYRF